MILPLILVICGGIYINYQNRVADKVNNKKDARDVFIIFNLLEDAYNKYIRDNGKPPESLQSLARERYIAFIPKYSNTNFYFEIVRKNSKIVGQGNRSQTTFIRVLIPQSKKEVCTLINANFAGYNGIPLEPIKNIKTQCIGPENGLYTALEVVDFTE